MPQINTRLCRRAEPVTREQKAALIAGLTRLMPEVHNKRAESVAVVIQEFDSDNWGKGGETITTRRERLSKGATHG